MCQFTIFSIRKYAGLDIFFARKYTNIYTHTHTHTNREKVDFRNIILYASLVNYTIAIDCLWLRGQVIQFAMWSSRYSSGPILENDFKRIEKFVPKDKKRNDCDIPIFESCVWSIKRAGMVLFYSEKKTHNTFWIHMKEKYFTSYVVSSVNRCQFRISWAIFAKKSAHTRRNNRFKLPIKWIE